MIVVIVVVHMRFITTGIIVLPQGAENDISVPIFPINISISTGTQIKDLLALLL